MSIIIKQKNGGLKFKSEAELENFVYIYLDRLLSLSPIAKQYRIGSEICDILATDSHSNNISIIELKNTEDRYIVQQLTRYYHGLIENKPKIDGIDYRKQVRLIAIAPSFHVHNHIDRKYSKLNIDFFTFALSQNRSTGDIFLELTDVDRQEKYQVPLPDTKPSKARNSHESTKTEIDYNEMIDYYLRLNHSSQLKIDPLTPEQFRDRSEKYKSKCTKNIKITFQFIRNSGTTQTSTTIKLPSKIRVYDFYQWCSTNLTGGSEGRGARVRQIHRSRSGVFKVRIWFN